MQVANPITVRAEKTFYKVALKARFEFEGEEFVKVGHKTFMDHEGNMGNMAASVLVKEIQIR